jgi:hypothetical protein
MFLECGDFSCAVHVDSLDQGMVQSVPGRHTRHRLLIRGLILLVVIAVALFAALRAFTKSGQAQPVSCDPGQACVTTNASLPGGWPGNSNQP